MKRTTVTDFLCPNHIQQNRQHLANYRNLYTKDTITSCKQTQLRADIKEYAKQYNGLWGFEYCIRSYYDPKNLSDVRELIGEDSD